jgi:competence protein ComGC
MNKISNFDSSKINSIRTIGKINSKHQQGFTLIEIFIVFVLASLVLIGIVALSNRVSATDDVNTMVKMAVDRAVSVKSNAGGGAPNYGTTSLNLSLERTGSFDKNFYRVAVAGTTATVTNKWNGATTVTGNTNNVIWTEGNVPGKICAGWLTKLSPDAYATVTVAAGTNTALPLPISSQTAAIECAGAGTITLATVS